MVSDRTALLQRAEIERLRLKVAHLEGLLSGVPQPAPRLTTGPRIVDLVIADLQRRAAVGEQRYGVPLQAGNGRDALRDAYEEALDLCQYLRQAMEEAREGPQPPRSCAESASEGERKGSSEIAAPVPAGCVSFSCLADAVGWDANGAPAEGGGT